ncbi:DNA-binding response regulator [Microbacterium sp. SLBN-111]|uniref:DNA-binding response regulator n=1 Tax=Microbacterium sp. SLBN-111 TaxID=3377733 RepID=UPI003C74B892
MDDHDLVGLALRNLVGSSPLMTFARHEQTVPAMTRHVRDADLVLLDLSLRDGSTPQDNVEALRRWGAHVLVLTSAENPYLVREASRTAALGIARKSLPGDDLLAAILEAAEGHHVPTTEWASALDSDPGLTAAPLTEREREVLSLYASGMGAREVAAGPVGDREHRERPPPPHQGRLPAPRPPRGEQGRSVPSRHRGRVPPGSAP